MLLNQKAWQSNKTLYTCSDPPKSAKQKVLRTIFESAIIPGFLSRQRGAWHLQRGWALGALAQDWAGVVSALGTSAHSSGWLPFALKRHHLAVTKIARCNVYHALRESFVTFSISAIQEIETKAAPSRTERAATPCQAPTSVPLSKSVTDSPKTWISK